MNSQAALQLINSIDQTIADIDSVAGSSTLADSYFAKFLVVYISGIYEEIVESILIDFASRNTSRSEVVEFVRKSMERSFRNPDADKVIALIKMFGNTSWTTTLNGMNAECTALDSIVNNKNALAHGQMVTITLTEVKDYYRLSRPLIEKIDQLLV